MVAAVAITRNDYTAEQLREAAKHTKDADAARQMDTLGEMLAERPILEGVGVTFDRIDNYEPLWKIEKSWGFEPGRRAVRP